MPDWTGNSKTAYSIIGASNHSEGERAEYDYYATDPVAVEYLLQEETFSDIIWECACGGGHIAAVLERNGYEVYTSDVVDRGYPDTEIVDFLKVDGIHNNKDIVTNPPYKYAKEFVEKALNISGTGTKIAMFLKLTFLEGKARRELFEKYPPSRIYVFSSRMKCAKNGDFENTPSSAVAYAWFVWEKGFEGDPVIKWIN